MLTHYLTTKEAAVLLGVNEVWLDKIARAGKVPCEQVGRVRRFHRYELLRWWRLHHKGPVLVSEEEVLGQMGPENDINTEEELQ